MKYILGIASLIFLPELYIWNCFVRGGNALWSVLYWIPFLLLVVSFVMGFVLNCYPDAMIKSFAGLLLVTVLPKLIFTIISLVGKGIAIWWSPAATTGNIIGATMAFLFLCAVVYGFTKGWKQVVIKRVDITSSEIPALFNGYKLVQLSDFHIGTYISHPEVVENIVHKVNDLQPDAIVFTGDLVNVSPNEVVPFMGILSRLEAKDGIYSILGNHDYCEYRHYDTPDGQCKSLGALKRIEHDLNWQLLLNEHRIITRGTDSIALIGVENDGQPPFPVRADLPKALKGVPKGIYQVLLSHDPSHWRRNVLSETDIQLTLSGHTHAMQLKIGNFSPARFSYPEWGGLYVENGRQLHVSTGTGSNIPFRFGAWPEIDLIVLHAAD